MRHGKNREILDDEVMSDMRIVTTVLAVIRANGWVEWRNLQQPEGCRLILARFLFSSVPKARDKSNKRERAAITNSFNAIEILSI